MASRAQTDKWIEAAYNAGNRDELKAAYNQWAASYDADMVLTGYVHFPVLTGLVGRHVQSRDAAILDAGVGTGALGALLNLLGYNNLSGLDMSDGMLAQAAARKVYADLRLGVLGERLDFVDKSFDAIISTGTFTQGHAPACAFDELVRLLEPAGILIFTVADSVWEAQGFKAKLQTLVAGKLLAPVESTPLYQPMPFSPAESHITTRAMVYRRIA
jgi:SAM-dependent methyltransferase